MQKVYVIYLSHQGLSDLIGAMGLAASNLAAGPDYERITKQLIRFQELKTFGNPREIKD